MSERYNHEAKDLHVAVGFTEDVHDEIVFKVSRIVTNGLTRSKLIEEAVNWATVRFVDMTERSLACILMGSYIEKVILMQSAAETMRDSLMQSISTQSIKFENNDNMTEFVKELKDLVSEYGGKSKDIGNGLFALHFTDETKKDTFHIKLRALEAKYGITGELTIDEGDPLIPYMGPVTKA